MALKEMYPGMINSPETTITNNINESDTIIYVLDPARVPEPPNLMTLGTGTNAETVKVLEINDNAITVERGFQGVAKSWPAGTVIARNFTEYDYNALKENIEDLEATKETPQGAQEKADAALNSAKQYTDQEVAEVSQALAAHKAENVINEGGAHGIEYEEGEWIPQFSTPNYTGGNEYIIQSGKYIRINNKVTLYGRMALSKKAESLTGVCRIVGLPFIPPGGAKNALIISHINKLNIPLGTLIGGYSVNDYILLLQFNGTTVSNINGQDLTDNTDIGFVFEHYI